MRSKTAVQIALLSGAASLVGCTQGGKTGEQSGAASSGGELPEYIASFDQESVIGSPTIVDCTLSGGEESQCVSITVGPAPANQKIGPFCPRNIADGPEKSGIWLESGEVYDADGPFIERLAEFYDDADFTLHDISTGNIRVTDSKIACEAAARPDVAEEYRNYCVECEVSYVEEGATQTYVIPLTPVNAESVSPRVSRSGVGLAFSGARFDAPAPTDAILAAHTLAPFDDCGGHVNTAVGYHLHAATDCLLTKDSVEGHAPKIGIALDGYPLLARLNLDGKEPEDLDMCRGHDLEGIGYHYHVDEPGSNAILPCHTGQTGCAISDPDAKCDASADAQRGPPPRG